MGPFPTPRRRLDPELMDAPGLPEAEVADAYRVLGRVNRQFFGGRPSLGRELDRWLSEDRPARGSRLLILDVGSGSGDLTAFAAERLRARGLTAVPIALDRDPTALRLATDDGNAAIRSDALRLPLAEASVDLVLAVKFAHHLDPEGLARLLSEMARVSRRRVIVLDIRRSWLAYWGFVAWSRVFTRNRLVRYDGPLSVLRGFLPAELEALPRQAGGPAGTFAWSLRRHAGFQLALVGRRIEPRG